MSDKTYKKTEIVGISSESFSEAVKSGIARASKTVRHMSWFEVSEFRGAIKDGKISEYQVTMSVGFRLDD